MNNSKLEERSRLKACYGTYEWSENSGICRKCKWKDDCGKIQNNKPSK